MVKPVAGQTALGLIETRGLVASIDAADALRLLHKQKQAVGWLQRSFVAKLAR